MKKVVVAFPRARYCSDGSGASQNYALDEKLIPILGGADEMRWEVATYATSGANARLQVTVSAGTKSTSRPSINMYSGVVLTSFPPGAPVLGVDETQISGPFAGLVDAALRAWDNAGTALTWVEAEVNVTLYYN